MSDVGERELLAIIFTDAVDSTARTASDEDYSLRILLADLDYMRNEAAVRGGTVLKNTGDGLLISFKSAVDAVECALSIQRGFANRAENAAFSHKIGVHIGDVIKKDGDIYGSGVNTASRLVAQCPPGGICMSSTLYELVKQKSQIGNLKVENFQVTNIEPPIKAYRVHSFEEAGASLPSHRAVSSKRIPVAWTSLLKFKRLWIFLVLGFLVASAFFIWKDKPFLAWQEQVEKNAYSFESKNYAHHFITVRDFVARIDVAKDTDEYRKATFLLLPGLVPGNGLVSFESLEYPNHFLKHDNFVVCLRRNDGSETFKKGATFRAVPGLSEASMTSFESIDLPNHFLRHQNWILRLQPLEDHDLYREDGTFRVRPPLVAGHQKTKELAGHSKDSEKIKVFDGRKYLFVREGKRWRTAKNTAQEMGGHLVSITSPEEQEFVWQLVSSQTNAPRCTWLGFSDNEVEGNWKWVTGEKVTYANWGPGNPDNWAGSQNYAWIGWYGNDLWDDGLEGMELPFVVEFEKPFYGYLYDIVEKIFGLRKKAENEITGRWKWFGGNTIVRFDSFGNGFEEGKENTVKLSYEIVDKDKKQYRIKWIDAGTGDVRFTDYLFLKNNGTFLEGRSILGQEVTANKVE